MIKALLFDWGGTCSPQGGVVESFCAALARATGLPLAALRDAYEVNNTRYLLGRMEGRAFWRQFARAAGIPEDEAFFIRLFRQAGRANPGMLALVRKLGKRYSLGLVSDNNKDLADFIERTYSLRRIFRVLVFSNRVGIKKPDSRIFLLACTRLGVRPGECLFIDDKEENVRAARALGMQALLFRGEARLKRDLSKKGIGD